MELIRRESRNRKLAALMHFGQWYTISAVARFLRCSETGAAARIRDQRKEKYGSRRVDKRRLPSGIWQYRMAK
jgi:hypothetical protein